MSTVVLVAGSSADELKEAESRYRSDAGQVVPGRCWLLGGALALVAILLSAAG